jgi:hypothetical protein
MGEGINMPWWAWVLIAVGAVVIGALKLMVFNRIRKNRTAKRRLADEE